MATGVLYLDVEGGRGGSSRSLVFLIRHLDRERFRPVVALREMGPSHDAYQALGVDHVLLKEMPAFRPGTRKNAVAFALFALDVLRSRSGRGRLKEIVAKQNIRLVHVNHEGLVPLGRHLARSAGIPWICHLRNTYADNPWSRWLYRLIATADGHVFISENERRHLVELAGLSGPPPSGIVVHNIAPDFSAGIEPDPRLADQGDRLRVLSLANLDAERGTDLVLDIAGELKARGREDFVFFICGKPSQPPHPWRQSFAEMLQARIADEGLGGMVKLVGHVGEPERALVASDVLLRPRRQNNPWGRDVIEGMAAGLPVLAMGRYQGFVETGQGGFIEPEFSRERIADHLLALKADPDLRRRMGAHNREKAARLFDGGRNAGAVAGLYADVLAGYEKAAESAIGHGAAA